MMVKPERGKEAHGLKSVELQLELGELDTLEWVLLDFKQQLFKANLSDEVREFVLTKRLYPVIEKIAEALKVAVQRSDDVLVVVDPDDGKCRVYKSGLEDDGSGWVYKVPQKLEVSVEELNGKAYIYELLDQRKLFCVRKEVRRRSG